MLYVPIFTSHTFASKNLKEHPTLACSLLPIAAAFQIEKRHQLVNGERQFVTRQLQKRLLQLNKDLANIARLENLIQCT